MYASTAMEEYWLSRSMVSLVEFCAPSAPSLLGADLWTLILSLDMFLPPNVADSIEHRKRKAYQWIQYSKQDRISITEVKPWTVLISVQGHDGPLRVNPASTESVHAGDRIVVLARKAPVLR